MGTMVKIVGVTTTTMRRRRRMELWRSVMTTRINCGDTVPVVVKLIVIL